MIFGPCWLLKYPILQSCKFASSNVIGPLTLYLIGPKKLSYVDTFIQFYSDCIVCACVCVLVQYTYVCG